ncbi:aromatic amino acid aminotransferase [Klebsiella variicola]|uniref:Aromatic amino acid aminotransferase n=1 Tax=Klebsiella variicola TaxID=244366 RepID=A0A7H4MIZ1_KLEVA|nr:aromatic amino acid aminotransferase [Klebsiella variicola]
MFQNVDAYAGDPILSLMEAFQQDPRADKVNLSIGLYYNEQAHYSPAGGGPSGR